MPMKPLHAFLVANLQGCRKSGTSASERGLRVSTERLTGETIIFFHTDSDEGRECLRITSIDNKVCDYFIYYSMDGRRSEIVCLLELKGTNLEDAEKQVRETHEHLKLLFNALMYNDNQNLIWRVCICLHNHAPNVNQRIRDRLKRDYGRGNVEIRHGVSHHDIGPLLRRDST